MAGWAGLPRVLLLLAAWAVWAALPAQAQDLGDGPSWAVMPLAAVPPALSVKTVPAMKELPTTVDKARNVKEVMKLRGVTLREDQKVFLNANKFLLIPKSSTSFKGAFGGACNGPESWDEMLGIFDSLCGSSIIQKRKPENAKLVTPDLMLHALHKYFDNTLEYVEVTELSRLLLGFLQTVRAGALAAKAAAVIAKGLSQADGQDGAPKPEGGDNAAGAHDRLAQGYERLAAQMTLALILLEDADWSNPGGVRFERPESQGAPAAAASAPATGGPAPVMDGPAPVPAQRGTLEASLQRLRGMEPEFSSQTVQAMQQELRAVYEARSVAASPLRVVYDPAGTRMTDYTQFTPRGHYAKSPGLRAYFRAMKFLGMGGYPLASEAGLSDSLLLMELAARPGPGGIPAMDAWRGVMEVTGFFAGPPDDVGFAELAALVGKTLKKDNLTPAEAVNPAVLATLTGNLSVLRRPAIAAPDKDVAFRLFGERFSVDAGILERLTAGREDQGVKLPVMPSALFVAAALGMKPAREQTVAFLKRAPESFGDKDIAVFLARLDQVATGITALQDSQWFGSLGSAWLGVLPTLHGVYGQGYPAYMQSPAFRFKEMQTVLGSYAELKHDTILYAKQLLAEYGEGSDLEPPPVPKGFVEPNMEFWNRFKRVVRFAREGLGTVQALRGDVRTGRIARFEEDVAFLASFAEKELRNAPVTATEYEKLRTLNLTYMAAPYFNQVYYEDEDRRSGLIADIFTNLKDGRILYEATGEPYVMLALVANENSPRLVVGVAFNHYELTGPLDRRATDQTWQARIYEGQGDPPGKNYWYQGLEPGVK